MLCDPSLYLDSEKADSLKKTEVKLHEAKIVLLSFHQYT